MTPLTDDLTSWFDDADHRADGLTAQPTTVQVGTVERIGDGVAFISGLPGARLDELLSFGNGVFGMAATLEPDRIGCVLVSPWNSVASGDMVQGTGAVVQTPVGPGLLGRVVDPLGRPLDGLPPPVALRLDPVDRPAPSIVDRELVTRPLQTGIIAIDAMIPLGRGQRELIIGDRQTGKTALVVDAIINQRANDVICIYAAIGQKSSSVGRVIESLRQYGAPERCIIVVGEAEGPPGLQWLTPYAACTMAEYFSEQGRDVLLAIDDLSKHAALYRQISLLLRRPPGREAYPGDIFYIHSRLLERAAHLSERLGGGSLTVLPVAETQAGNMSAYIPTNLISITDGQIYLEPQMFHEGQKPAVSIGKSVSRVGGKTQAPAMRDLAQRLRLEYTQFLELEVFTRFGSMADARTARAVDHGRRIRQILTQPQYHPLRLGHQIALLLALELGVLDGLTLNTVDQFKAALGPWLDERCPSLIKTIDDTGKMDTKEDLAAVLRALASTMPASP